MDKQFDLVKESLINTIGYKLTLDDLLEEISVIEEWDNEVSEILIGWYAVVTPLGIISYFGSESEALGYRLSYINRILNG